MSRRRLWSGLRRLIGKGDIHTDGDDLTRRRQTAQFDRSEESPMGGRRRWWKNRRSTSTSSEGVVTEAPSRVDSPSRLPRLKLSRELREHLASSNSTIFANNEPAYIRGGNATRKRKFKETTNGYNQLHPSERLVVRETPVTLPSTPIEEVVMKLPLVIRLK